MPEDMPDKMPEDMSDSARRFASNKTYRCHGGDNSKFFFSGGSLLLAETKKIDPMTRWSLGRNKFVLQYHAAESAFQLFPTCQVRVVRFYQSCSRLASPPPPASSPPKAQNHGISTTRVDQTPGTRGKSWFPLVHQIAVIPALNSTNSTSISGQISVNLIFCRVWLV